MIDRLVWTGEAWADYLYWQNQDRKTLKRINRLIKSAMRQPTLESASPRRSRVI